MCRIKFNQRNVIILSQVIEFIPTFLDLGALCPHSVGGLAKAKC